MTSSDNTYITTTLPYVNSDPHIGFALEIIHADVFARYKALNGNSVFFNTGTDEHGIKIYKKATEAGREPQDYVDEYAKKFDLLKNALNLSYNNFIRTTDVHHMASAQEFWNLCDKNGDIYKKNYTVKYCVGCELEKTDSELQKGKCPHHPTTALEIIEEENYFFRFSNYKEQLVKLYEHNADFVVPSSRTKEIKTFVERGLTDFSISRLASKMPWGVPVPNDKSQVMYVWFDALVNYISAIGWPHDMSQFNKWWPVTQFAGKDNLRQQSAMWQAMLMSAGISPSKQIVIHGFITSDGAKMSKSVGNVVNPFDLVNKYSTDALRYFLTREITPFEDGDFTIARFKEAYNANLANGIGNLTARIMTLSQTHLTEPVAVTNKILYPSEYAKNIEQFEFSRAIDFVWDLISNIDLFIAKEQPYKKIKTNSVQAKKDIKYMVNELWIIANLLAPFLPDTSVKILTAIKLNKKPEPLFVRL